VGADAYSRESARKAEEGARRNASSLGIFTFLFERRSVQEFQRVFWVASPIEVLWSEWNRAGKPSVTG
jgi:hypothetical protein